MEMVANRFMVHIESLDAELTSADYLFLIRLTEENFA